VSRQPRDRRRRGVSLVVTPRDEAVLRAVARFRLCRTSDLERLFFPGRNRDVIASRLRRLFDAAYLEAHVPERAAENLYSLGAVGKDWIRSAGGSLGPMPRPPWEHHLAIVQIWSHLASSVHGLTGARLVGFQQEWEIRQGPSVLRPVPDALIELAGSGGRVRLALEVDRGTESLEILRKKFREFEEVRRMGDLFGWTDFAIVVRLADGGERRADRVRELLAAEWGGEHRILTTLGDLTGMVAELVRAPVTESRCGNGGPGVVSADRAVGSIGLGEGPSGDG